MFRVRLTKIRCYKMVSLRDIYFKSSIRRFRDNKYRDLNVSIMRKFFELWGNNLIRMGTSDLPHIGVFRLYMSDMSVRVAMRGDTGLKYNCWSFRVSDTYARKAFYFYDNYKHKMICKKLDINKRYKNIKNYDRQLDPDKRRFL